MKDSIFWKCMRNYFHLYLPKQRNSSVDTILACRAAWNLFLRYLMEQKRMDIRNLEFEDFNEMLLSGFLEHMDSEKGWKASTRNHRLSCIRSFFKYAAAVEPLAYTAYTGLLSIPLKKDVDQSRIVEHMSKEAISELLCSPDSSTRNGLRDQFFMTLMYDTAARNGEMLNMKLADIDSEKKLAILMGKGRKLRMVPVSKETLEIFKRYRDVFHASNQRETFLFYTKRKGEKVPMSADNVARFIRKYAEIAHMNFPGVPTNVHPHMFRHSRAMHLYQSGMSLSLISELLGHANPETTLIYAHADTEMKRKAIESAGTLVRLENPIPIWQDIDILEQLLSYG